MPILAVFILFLRVRMRVYMQSQVVASELQL